MRDWIAPLFTLLGAVIGIGGTLLITRLQLARQERIARMQLERQEQKDRNRFVPERLENLHQLLGSYADNYTTLGSELAYLELLDKPSSKGLKVDLSTRSFAMLIRFYAPELRASFDELEELGHSVPRLLLPTYVQSDKVKRRQVILEITDIAGLIEQKCTAMQEVLAQISKQYL
jgi:hypothetical protein